MTVDHTVPLQAGIKAHQSGEIDAAIAHYTQSLQCQPSAEAYTNLGAALRQKGHTHAAITVYLRALGIDPTHLAALSNLGGAFRTLGEVDKAISVLGQATQLNPYHAATHYNLGQVWMDAGEPHKAISCFDTAIQLAPGKIEAQFYRATCVLQSGDLLNGFAAYECRFDYEKRLVRAFSQPRWDGSSLSGRTLLLYAEQGFGDTLQFIRYVDLIPKEQGSRLILECQASLKRLMESIPHLDQVVVQGEPLPEFDVHVSLLSLPYLFQTTLDTIPARVPYLSAPESKATPPQFADTQRLKVGIVWASGHQDAGVRNRTIPLINWTELLAMPQAQFFSLQKGLQTHELEIHGFTTLLDDLSSDIHDFADTAAILEGLDLLISADTAIVHLAGALNKPVWVVLPCGSEWRWLLNRSDSPWYPSLRLFRQTLDMSWDQVIDQVRIALLQHIQNQAQLKNSL